MSYFQSIDRFAEKFTHQVIRFRWLVIFAAIFSAITIASGGRFLEFASNYRVFFSSENPELTAFEKLQSTYTKNDNFLFVLEPENKNVFEGDTLVAVEKLTKAAWKIPFAIRVDSLSNFQYTHSIEDDLIVEDLVRNAHQLSAEQLIGKGEVALAEPLLRAQLITEDYSATAINVILQYPEKSLTEVPEAVSVARELRDSIEAEFPHIKVSLTGVSMLNNAFMEAGMRDMGSLMPTMFVIILALLLVILRSVSATIATLAVIMLSTMVAMGLAGFSGIKLTPISGSAPIVILTLAIADSIHVLISLRTLLREGMAKTEAIVEAVRLNFLPISITSLTTIIGFGALNFSDSPPFWHLGNITAMGIAAAWLFSLTLLPALVSILPLRVSASHQSGIMQVAMGKIANLVIANPRTMLITTGGITALLIAFIPQIDFNDRWTQYFDQRIEFRTETDQALKHFGMYPIEYSMPARAPGGVSDPEFLNHLERFTEFLRSQPEVKHVYSLTDIMQRLNKNLHSDNPQYYRLPDEHEMSAQYLLLYEMSLPYGLDLNDRVNIDKSATRVTATLGDVDTQETKRFLNAADQWLKDNVPPWMYAKPTSAQVMFTYITDRNVSNMITGTLIAIIAIALIMVFALRSFLLGMFSLIPNSLPILASFGTWALLVGEVGFSIATVASVSLGIIVDDTVHFLSKYVRARQERGLSAEDSVRYAFNSVGVAILVNSVILIIGFLVLITSSFKINADMGLLTALAIAFALVLDFLFLPALLLITDRRNKDGYGENTMKTNNTSSVAATMAAVGIALGIGLFTAKTVEANTAITPTRGETVEQKKGFDIAARSDRSDRGFGDSDVKLEMILRNAAGEQTSRNLRIATLEIPNESVGDRSLVVFSSPRDIEGTALLSHAQILEPDDQWLYLPSIKRVKRVSSANKSGPFVGSEFAFEDFTSLELNKFDYLWLREEACDGFRCDVVERIPRYENSGYTKQIVWIDQDVFQVRKVEFYDRRGDLLKILTLNDYRNYKGVWRAHKLDMTNEQTGKSTSLVYHGYMFGVGLSDQDFVKGKLKRLR